MTDYERYRVICLERSFSFFRIGFRVFGEGSEGDYPFLGFISYGQSEKGTLWQGLERVIDFVSRSNEEIIDIFLSNFFKWIYKNVQRKFIVLKMNSSVIWIKRINILFCFNFVPYLLFIRWEMYKGKTRNL